MLVVIDVRLQRKYVPLGMRLRPPWPREVSILAAVLETLDCGILIPTQRVKRVTQALFGV